METCNGGGRKRSSEIQKRQNIEHNSFASAAIQKRIDLVNEIQDQKITLEITDHEQNGIPTGTLVKIKFPLKK